MPLTIHVPIQSIPFKSDVVALDFDLKGDLPEGLFFISLWVLLLVLQSHFNTPSPTPSQSVTLFGLSQFPSPSSSSLLTIVICFIFDLIPPPPPLVISGGGKVDYNRTLESRSPPTIPSVFLE